MVEEAHSYEDLGLDVLKASVFKYPPDLDVSLQIITPNCDTEDSHRVS